MEMQWQPPPVPPPLPPYGPARNRSRWLPAAITGAAIVIAAGLVAGALILNKDRAAPPSADAGTTTCEAWAQTRDALRAVPPLPNGWTWNTPNIDLLIKFQNGPVGYALDQFEPRINLGPADVAQAAQDYLSARRAQMRSLANRSYQPADGAAVDAALSRLNELCKIPTNSRPA